MNFNFNTKIVICAPIFNLNSINVRNVKHVILLYIYKHINANQLILKVLKYFFFKLIICYLQPGIEYNIYEADVLLLCDMIFGFSPYTSKLC